jgi:hypothetical protein
MILFNIFHNFLVFVFDTLSQLPGVILLPFGMSDALLTASSYWYDFLNVFWPLQIVWQCVLWYALFKISLVTLRLFIGSRAPDAS